MTVFATGLGFPEAPVLLPDGGLLIVEMSAEKGHITHLSADGKTHTVLAKTGRPNGLARDRHGVIWVAETHLQAVLQMQMDGSYESFVSACEGRKFLFLNDIACGPNGDVYFTDSGIEIETLAPAGDVDPNYSALTYDGRVYRVDVETRKVELLDQGLKFVNGLAFGPDAALYVNETLTGNIYRYAQSGDGPGPRETFANVIEHFNPNELKGPDGMKFGADGHLYVAVFGQGDITVVGRRGEIIKRMATIGKYPTNLAFGPPGSKQIYVTEMESGTIQILDVATDGLPLHG